MHTEKIIGLYIREIDDNVHVDMEVSCILIGIRNAVRNLVATDRPNNHSAA
jgi:hypothetical protein